MFKQLICAMTALLLVTSGASAGGQSVVEKSGPLTKIVLVKDGPEPVYVIKGEIDPGADDVFEQVVGKRQGGWLVLASQGGDLSASIWIGRMAHYHHIKTYVPTNGTCLSGCAYIWAAGAERWVARGAKLAFHRPWHLVDGEVVEGDVDRARRYFKEMGYNDVAIRWFLVPPEDFFVLTAEEAKKFGIAANFRN